MAAVRSGPQPGEFRWSLEILEPRDPESTLGELTRQIEDIAGQGGGSVQLWLPNVAPGEDDVVAGCGFAPYRDLWQLRCALPLEPTDLHTRPFTAADAEAFLQVNNAAFHWHPEQGGMTHEVLQSKLDEPWVDLNGFLLHEIDGRLAGFNWTKEHRKGQPQLGEIYAVAVHPDFHGQGLGRALTLAGMAHLHAAGLDIGMLYVEADNDAANRTYARVGFTRHQTSRAYRAEVPPT